MKVFLDDVRFGDFHDLGERWYEWILVRTVENCKTLLDTGLVTEISLDFDLSHTDGGHTGEDVLRYVIEKMETEKFEPPYIMIHSRHTAAERMQELVQEIKRNTTTLVDIKAMPPYPKKTD